MTHTIGDITIDMERGGALCSLRVEKNDNILIDVNGITDADMRKITKVISDSPFIYNDQNTENNRGRNRF